MKHFVHVSFSLHFPDYSNAIGDTLLAIENTSVEELRKIIKEWVEKDKGKTTESMPVITSITEISEDLYNILLTPDNQEKADDRGSNG